MAHLANTVGANIAFTEAALSGPVDGEPGKLGLLTCKAHL